MIIRYLITTLAMLLPVSGMALDAMPQKGGVHGIVGGSVDVSSAKSNVIATSGFFRTGSSQIESLTQGPSSTGSHVRFFPVIALSYTTEDLKAQALIGISLFDYVRFDRSFNITGRYKTDDGTIWGAGVLFTPTRVELWQDPYVTGQPRVETEKQSYGMRLAVDNIADSKWSLRYYGRRIDIERERSGDFLNLSRGDKNSLRRSGFHHYTELFYDLDFAFWNQWYISVAVDRSDREGASVSYWGLDVNFSGRLFLSRNWFLLGNATTGFNRYDKNNPVYDKREQAIVFGLSASVGYAGLFSVQNLTAAFRTGFYREESNIDFFDGRVSLANISLIYRY